MMAQLDGYLERNIKELLAEYPGLGDVLSGYGIGCVTCTEGSCAVKDIVQYHYLPVDRQRALMQRMAQVIEGGEPEPAQQAAEPAVVREITYSAPMADLVREHALIKRWLALIPSVLKTLDLASEEDRKLIRFGIGFIQTYADKYHHAKEEDILFTRFDETQQILRVMLEDHTAGRSHVKAMLQALEQRDEVILTEHLLAYRDLLTEHIRKEDEILYPWMDRQLSPEQIETLQREFDQADSRFDPGMVRRFEEFIEGIERTAV